MKYFIRHLSESQIDRLNAGCVVFCEHTTARKKLFWGGTKGHVFDEPNFMAACAVLGVKENRAARKVDNDFILATLIPDGEGPQAFVVRICDCAETDEGIEQRLVPIVRELILPHVSGDVVIHHGEGEPTELEKEDGFHIHLFSAPNERPIIEGPFRLYGIDASKPNHFAAILPDVPLEDDDGAVFGEICNANAYFYHDALGDGSEGDLTIFRRGCEEISARLSLSADEQLQRRIRLEHDADQRRRDAYYRLCSGRIATAITNTRKAVETDEEQIRNLEIQLRTAHLNRLEHSQLLASLESNHRTSRNSIDAEYERIKNAKKVKRLEIEGNTIKVWTVLLYNRAPKGTEYYEIGEMYFEIKTEGRSLIVIKNLTRRRDGAKPQMHHPHISPDGTPCFGNSDTMFAKLAGTYEYSAMISLAIQFVETHNPHDSWGSYIQNWPKVPADQVAELRAAGMLP